jgi:hypothetical protein
MLIVSYLVGSRDGGTAYEFMQDVGARLANKLTRARLRARSGPM